MKICGKTDRGCVRSSNQDALEFASFHEKAGWAVVCDGMGGAAGGNVASSLAVKVVSDYITISFRDHMEEHSAKAVLKSALLSANSEVFEQAMENPDLRGMGTTCIAAVIVGGRVCLAHVGDSRAYLIEEDGIRQLTVDHTVVQQMLENGQLTQEQVKTHPNRNIITRALGVVLEVAIDYVEEPFPEGTALVICTDGLTSYVEADEIEETLRKMPERFCDEMIGLAKERGGADNITVVLMRAGL